MSTDHPDSLMSISVFTTTLFWEFCWKFCLTPKPQNTPLLWSIASLSNIVTLQLVQHLALARHNVTATSQCGNRKWWVQALVFVDNWPISVLIITYLKQKVPLLIFPWWLLVPSKWMFHKNLDFLAWYLRCRTPEVPWGLKFWWHWDHQWAYGIWAVHAWFWPSILAIDLLRRGCSLGQTLMLFLTLSTPRSVAFSIKRCIFETTRKTIAVRSWSYNVHGDPRILPWAFCSVRCALTRQDKGWQDKRRHQRRQGSTT